MPRAAPTAFPTLAVRSLTGVDLVLPGEFPTARAVVAVAFRRRQQADVDTWMPALLALEDGHDDLRAYELPCIGRRWSAGRRVIDGGMVAGIPDPDARARTLTSYTDVGAVQRALGLRDAEEIAVVLTDRRGRIAWMGTGPWTAAAGDALAQAAGPRRR